MFRWLLSTFTEPHDYVLDMFVGRGGLGRTFVEDMRHCMCLELDDVLYKSGHTLPLLKCATKRRHIT